MGHRVVPPSELRWETRPHEPSEPARHVAELSDALDASHVRANVWRYEPGAQGKRHRHAEQEETFVVLAGTLTIYLGEPPERVVVPTGRFGVRARRRRRVQAAEAERITAQAHAVPFRIPLW